MLDDIQNPEDLEQDDIQDAVLDGRRISAIRDAVEEADAERVNRLLEPLHSADIADLLEQVEPDERESILLLAPNAVDGDVLSELEETIREEVILALPPEVLNEAVRDLDSDDVVDLIEAPASSNILTSST